MNINQSAYNKIYGYAKHSSPGEIGGLLLGRIQKNGKFLITKAILLGQRRSNFGFEINEDDMMEFTKNADEKILKSVIGWWHSHGEGLLDFSPDDDRTFKRLCNFLPGVCVGILVTMGKNSGYKFRIDLIHSKTGNVVTIDDIKPKVIGKKKRFNFKFLSRIDELEIEKKVVTSNMVEVNWDTCLVCEGSGIIFSDNKRRNIVTQESRELLAYQENDNYSETEEPYDEDEYYGR